MRARSARVPERELPAERDAVRERHRVGDDLERSGKLLDREERAREQEHRQDHEPEDRDERGVGLRVRAPRRDRCREREPDEHGHRDREDAERRLDRPEGRDHDQVDGRGDEHAERDERLVPEHDVRDPERRREHRVVLAAPLDRREHRPARLEGRDLHRRRGQEAGRHEVEVGDALREVGAPVDERAEPVPEREQVDDRRHDRRDDGSPPHPPVLGEEELERPDREAYVLMCNPGWHMSGRGVGNREVPTLGSMGRFPHASRRRALLTR